MSTLICSDHYARFRKNLEEYRNYLQIRENHLRFYHMDPTTDKKYYHGVLSEIRKLRSIPGLREVAKKEKIELKSRREISLESSSQTA